MAISPVNGAVLGAAAVVVSPTWWFVYQGTLPLADALTRYLLVVPLCWAAINVVAEFFFPRPGATQARAEEPVARSVGTEQGSFAGTGSVPGTDGAAAFGSPFGGPTTGQPDGGPGGFSGPGAGGFGSAPSTFGTEQPGAGSPFGAPTDGAGLAS